MMSEQIQSTAGFGGGIADDCKKSAVPPSRDLNHLPPGELRGIYTLKGIYFPAVPPGSNIWLPAMVGEVRNSHNLSSRSRKLQTVECTIHAGPHYSAKAHTPVAFWAVWALSSHCSSSLQDNLGSLGLLAIRTNKTTKVPLTQSRQTEEPKTGRKLVGMSPFTVKLGV